MNLPVFLDTLYSRPGQLFEKRPAKEKKLQLQRKPGLLGNLGPDGKIGADQFAEPGEGICPSCFCEQIGKFLARTGPFVAGDLGQDRVAGVDEVGAPQGVVVDGVQKLFRLPALENPAGYRAVRVDGAAVFLGKEETGPVTSLPPDLEQLNRHRLKPANRGIVTHFPLPDNDQLIGPDMALPDKIEIIPAQNWPALPAAGAALSALIRIRHT